jgi:hypothetical protein
MPTPRWQHHEAVLGVRLDAVGAGVAPESWIATRSSRGVPALISGRRQICSERVTATYTWLFLLFSVMPFGDGALSPAAAARRSSAGARRGPLGSAMPLCPWSVKYRSPLSAKCRVVQALEALAERGLETRLDLSRSSDRSTSSPRL